MRRTLLDTVDDVVFVALRDFVACKYLRLLDLSCVSRAYSLLRYIPVLIPAVWPLVLGVYVVSLCT